MKNNKYKHVYLAMVIQHLGTIIIRFFVKIFWAFPIKNNRVFSSSYVGRQYSCNPKYITDYLGKKYCDKFDIVWALKKPSNCSDVNIKSVKFLSLSHFYYFCTSKIIIDNVGFPTYMPKRKGQYVINTWHGGGAYKNCSPESTCSSGARIALNAYKSKNTDLVLSSCSRYSQVAVSDTVYRYSGEILPSGLPRNDVFFSKRKVEIKRRVYEKLSIDTSKLMILYAPTFRGGAKLALASNLVWIDTSIAIPELCLAVKKRFNADPVFVFRAHHQMEGINTSFKCIDATNYPDMQELLCAADILISDYSSSIWDFSLMKKPCFLYVPDMDYYINEDRGVYTPIEDWPGIIAKTNQELQKAVLEFDEDSYRKKVEKHHKDLGSYETGTACEQVCKRIAEVCGVGSE